MVILAFGDVFAKPGRKAVSTVLPELKEKYQPDFILANAENLSGGKGVNYKSLREMMDLGFNGFTGGNHIWDNKEILKIMEDGMPVVRPANYPDPKGNRCPGRGAHLIESKGKQLYIASVMGRIFMDPLNCPFEAVDELLREAPTGVPIFLDVHAEATSEKNALAWYVDGKVSAVVGTHTHIQTADERIFPRGTAFITDLGMTGAFDSVIGITIETAVSKFVTKRRQPFQVATENLGVGYVVIELDSDNKATKIERHRYTIGQA